MSFETVALTLDLHPELEEYRRQFQEIRDDALSLTAHLSEAQGRWRPAPDRWSVAEALEHLNITGRKILVRLDRVIEREQKRRDPSQPPPQSFRRTWFGKFLVRLMEPPVKRRLRAPRAYVPEAEVPTERSAREVFTEFVSIQEQLMLQVRRSQGLDLGAIRLASPVAKWLRLPLGQWFAFIAAHERRHVWQARQVTRQPGFPAP